MLVSLIRATVGFLTIRCWVLIIPAILRPSRQTHRVHGGKLAHQKSIDQPIIARTDPGHCNAVSNRLESRMFRILFSMILGVSVLTSAQPITPPQEKPGHGRPAVIDADQLVEFETLPADRKKLIAGALAVARDSPWLPYFFGGSDPKDGGFDCSGAMYFVMRKAGLQPPRTSANQFEWLKENQRLIQIPEDAVTLEHPVFKPLRPGDLLFWGGTYAPVDGRQANITHVALFLGHEKRDGRAVMINATDGRSYR